jgi:hypothetical protein
MLCCEYGPRPLDRTTDCRDEDGHEQVPLGKSWVANVIKEKIEKFLKRLRFLIRTSFRFSRCQSHARNTKGGSITVPLTSCMTGLDESVLQIKTKIVSCYAAISKPVKQEVNGTVILPPLVFPGVIKIWFVRRNKLERLSPDKFFVA